MSKIKLVIEINEENYKRIKDDIYDTHDIHRAIISIRRSTPFEMLDKIRVEISEYKDDKIIHAERNEMIDIVLGIIDKYREESEDKE